jgi:SH3 domain-containing YSC84-like protein 1
MKIKYIFFLIFFIFNVNVFASAEEEVLNATNSFKRFVETDKIPPQVLQQAKALVIIPNFIKAGFFIGGQYGKGIAVLKKQNGWSNPFFVKVTGGSLGIQFGVESSDTLLVFRTNKSVKELLKNKITLGAEVSAAVGPFKENYNAYTEGNFQSDIYTYHIKEGLFVGASFDGAVITHNNESNSYLYATSKVSQIVAMQKKLNLYALRELDKYLNRYAK